jgi:two-component system, response regulator PdtaR
MKLLIVEDEMIIAMRLEQFVTDLGHQVCAMASTEDGAIASAEVHRPDVVLMDLRLAHGGSGAEAACGILTQLLVKRCKTVPRSLSSRNPSGRSSWTAR